MKLSDLKSAPYNPRNIIQASLDRLGDSIDRYGDLSGIVFNARTKRLVAGHQRVKELIQMYGDLEWDTDTDFFITPKGEKFRVRIVMWDEKTERMANIAANSLDAQGEFDEDKLREMLEDMESHQENLLATELSIQTIKAIMNPEEDEPEGEDNNDTGPKEVTCPECGEVFTP